ncbi:MAG: helix-turn-helix domain-containing protein [Bacteroidota bacterium]
MSNGTLGDFIINVKYNFIGVMSLMIFYTILTYSSFKKNALGRNKTRWLRWLLGSFACYVLAMTAYFILSRLGVIHTGHDYFITYTLVLFIAMVSYFGFVQPNIFDGQSMDTVLPFQKYRNTGLTQAHSQELKNGLLQYMKTEKPYLNSNLRLDDLAEKLNLSRHHTSQVINEHFDTNFFDFINTYRIEEAKNLLVQNDHLNITDIIFSCGFNNRASFYKTFKKHTAMTPSEFNEHHNNHL